MSKPPMSLNENFVSRLRSRDPVTGQVEDDDILDSLERAMVQGRTAAEAVDAVVTAVAADTTQTDGAKALKIRQVALQRGEAAGKTLDAAKAEAVAAIADLESEIASPPPPDSATDLTTAILGRLAALSEAERAKVMANAISTNDAVTLHAVLSSPAWLSGHTEVGLASRRSSYQAKNWPKESAKIRTIRKALESVERGGQALVAWVTEIAETPRAMLAETASTRAATAVEAAKPEAA